MFYEIKILKEVLKLIIFKYLCFELSEVLIVMFFFII